MTKATYGDGSIAEVHWARKDGTAVVAYRCEIWVGSSRRTKQSRKRRVVEQWRAAQLLERSKAQTGLVVDPIRSKRVTYNMLAKLLRRAWDENRYHLKPRTLRSYRNEIDRMVDWWGPRFVKSTTQKVFNEFIRHENAARRRAGLGPISPSTECHYLDRLSQLHQIGIEEELIAGAPCTLSRPAVLALSAPDLPSAETVKALLAAAARHPDPRLLLIHELTAHAGIRIGDLGRLRKEDAKIHEWDGRTCGRIRLPVRSLADSPKGKREVWIPIFHDGLFRALAAALERPSDWLLGSWRAEPTVRGAADEIWMGTLGCRSRLHSLRHWIATCWAVRYRVPLPVIQVWLGHRSISTTQRYVHPEDWRPEYDDDYHESATNFGRSADGAENGSAWETMS